MDDHLTGAQTGHQGQGAHDDERGKGERPLPGAASRQTAVQCPAGSGQVQQEKGTSKRVAEGEEADGEGGEGAEGLRDPNAGHVGLQQTPVQLRAGLVVHEDMVEEGAQPGTKAADQVTVRQVGRQAVFSWGQQLVAIQQDVENGQTVAHDIECLIVQGAD